MKRIYSYLLSLILLLGLQSCFQDMEQNPSFDYPEEPEPLPYSDLKMFFPFEDNADDLSLYEATTTGSKFSFTDGVKGKAYQGGKGSYLLIDPNKKALGGEANLVDSLTYLESFTISFWINSKRNEGACGIFTISNTKHFWGNLDVFLENTGSETEAFFKIHMLNARAPEEDAEYDERWVEQRIENVFGEWSHIVFRYDGEKSIFDVFHNGEKINSHELKDYGSFKFKNMGPCVIGALQFMTEPSLTSATGLQDWASYYSGALDQFRFYNKALSDEFIIKLYSDKE